jgi:hypothetical protein
MKANIVVFGRGKSGTTALYFRIKNSLRDDYTCLFEPFKKTSPENVYNCLKNRTSFLVKNVNINVNKCFSNFDKKVHIIRDPRDRLISRLLFIGGTLAPKVGVKSTEEIKRMLDLIKEKENDPQSVTVVDLFNEIYSMKKEEVRDWVTLDCHRVFNFEESIKDSFLIKYEDFIVDNVQSLEEYLEFKLSDDNHIDEQYAHIARSKCSGSWRNWFTEEDVEFFEPLMRDYMMKYHYCNWELPSAQVISPETSSEYFAKMLDKFICKTQQ